MRKAVQSFLISLWLLFPAHVFADDIMGPEKIVGIVALAQLCYWDCDGYDEPLPLYYEPDEQAVSATFLLHEDIENWPEFEEYDYKVAGALVYETKEGWYRISRNKENLWVRAQDSKGYHPYPEILEGKYTFFIGKIPQLWQRPSGPVQSLQHVYHQRYEGQFPVKVLKRELINDRWWLKVAFLEESPCIDSKKRTVQEGWVPAYDKNNQMQFWFYSRGCSQ